MPTRPAEILQKLKALGVRPDRRLGQSFLADPFVADSEAALVGTKPPGPVLEVGGGLGILTEALLRRGIAPLTVLERDRRLAEHLRRTFGERITVVEGDALTEAIPEVRAAVGNLPYSVATPILVRMFAARIPRVVSMVQREVADRLTASYGSRSYGRLTIIARLFGSIEPFQVVPPAAFVPEPAVASQIVAFTARSGPLPVDSFELLEKVLHALFSSRRKQLGNLLLRLASDTERLAEEAGWPPEWPTRRPEDLPPEAFYGLANALGARSGARIAAGAQRKESRYSRA
ncbi:MAG: 16S rRNA (adenine(1518)-N(6)/adenine(1519)-N(6))-dimethyltransferase RsmA [Thermoplasmata archaeon]|nr:16S rRNA (adenine(1518)-N(6)/adenine(1519)-N(6))-dimethyltransferase RsmA [Thermoplasmata archaeon]MCI4359785.1 16S rRNA (adenine(1518)-N(6)/adenine(1519)-N(6))-dimethyltransferase RsmA [Thermoplasmata archaeon]